MKEKMTPELTFKPAAIARFQGYLAHGDQAIGVRISVKMTGCSGYAYQVQVAKEAIPEDLELECEGVRVFIDPKSYPFVQGSCVDYIKEDLQEKFVFDNPNERGSCGCGESFTVEPSA